MSYVGGLALSPAARLALKVIFVAPRSPATKPLLVVPSVGSVAPYVLLASVAVTEAAFLLIVKIPWVRATVELLRSPVPLSLTAGAVSYVGGLPLAPAPR